MAHRSGAARNLEPAQTHAPRRPIDLVHLAKQCLGDEELEFEVLRLFDTSVDTYLGKLLAAEEEQGVAFNLHALKSAASGVGAWTVAELAREGEIELAQGAFGAERREDIRLAVEETRSFIASMLSNAAA